MIASWPKVKKNFINPEKEKEFASVKEMVMEIRNWKIDKKISPKEIVEYKIGIEKRKILTQIESKDLIEKLGKIKLVP